MNAHDQLARQLLDGIARHRRRRRPHRILTIWRSHGMSATVVACSCAAALGVAAFALVSVHPRLPASSPGTLSGRGKGQASGVCRSHVRDGALPIWARTGFSPPTRRMRFVLGTSGSIAAILFGDPLLSPPSPSRRNKILWVSRIATHSGSDLHIAAQPATGRNLARAAVTRTVRGSPGPLDLDYAADHQRGARPLA